MNKNEKEMLHTIIGKLEHLQKKTKNEKAKERLGNAKTELLRIQYD